MSRQPAILRSPDQTEYELNTWASLASGVGKRPPTQTIAQVMAGLSSNAFVHHINRDTSERYVVVIENGTIRVFDLEGNSKVVNFSTANMSYLEGSSFTAVTVADYTFIVNRSKVCSMQSAGADLVPQETYLRWLSNTTSGALNPWAHLALAVSGAALQYRPNPNVSGLTGTVPSMEKLPENAPNGAVYKVSGSSGSAFKSYYVVRDGAVWNETVKPGQANAIDPLTMPHCLIREGDGSFTFAPFSWAPRRVGDTDTNPNPTFIGRTISDVYFYQNRLAFLVDENVIFSCAGDFGNFWRTTVLDSISSDVVDVAISTSKVSKLLNAVLFDDGAILFADQTQFSLTNGEDGITPSSVAIRPITHYRINKRVRPVVVGTEVYFAGDQNGSSVVWEYTRLSDQDSTSAAEITAHVPGYLPAGLTQLIPLTKGLLALTGGPKVYCYQLYWSGNEKVQSAWREWEFGGNVVSGTYVDNLVFLLIQRGDGLYLEKMDLGPTAKPAGQPRQVYLDRQVTMVGSYNPATDETSFLLPFEPVQNKCQLIRGAGTTAPHSLVDPTSYMWEGPVRVTVPGNLPGPVTIGETYQWRFQFSEQFPVNYQGQPLTTGRLQLRTFTVNYADTAFFRTEVSPYGAALSPEVEEIVPAKLADFTGKVIGAASLKLNSPIYHTGSYSFQIYGESKQATITLSNDTHCATTVVSAEWEGFYSNRSFR